MKLPEHPKRKSPTLSLRRPLLFAGALALLAAPRSKAADGTWTQAGNGNWFDASNWSSGVVADGAGAVANLSGATGRTVSIAGTNDNVRLGELTFDTGVSPQWTLTGGTITLDSGSPSERALITSGNGGSTVRLEIASRLEGSSGLKIVGGRYIISNTANSFTGGVELANAIVILYPGAFGSNPIEMTAGTSNLQLRSGTHPNAILLKADNVLIAAGTSGAVIAGTISEETAGTGVRLLNNTTNCLLEISGNNSYTGNTTLGATGTIQNTTTRISSSTAFGAASAQASVSFTAGSGSSATLELANNIDVKSRTLTLAGIGRDGKGSLSNFSGNNQWSGDIALGTLDNATVGVAAETTLTIGGSISGNATGGLIKTGDGTLVLKGINQHTTGTFVNAGTLVAGNSQAVAGGNLSLSGTASLGIAAGVQLGVNNLTLGTGNRLGFHLNGDATATSIAIAGQQIGSGTFTVDIFNAGGLGVKNYTLLSAPSGSYAATNFVLGLTPGGFSGDLNWNAGVLTLNVTAVPEPTSAGFLGVGIALVALGGAARRYARSR